MNLNCTVSTANSTITNAEKHKDVDILHQLYRLRNWVFFPLFVLLIFISMMIILTAKVNRLLKTALCNIVINNAVFIVEYGLFWAFVRGYFQSHDFVCRLFVVLLGQNQILGHVSVVGISLNTFLAVRFPFWYSRMNRSSTILVGLLIAWLGTTVLVTLMFGWNNVCNKKCMLLTAVPRYAITIYATCMLVIDLFVVLMNIMICKTLISKRNRVSDQSNTVGIHFDHQNADVELSTVSISTVQGCQHVQVCQNRGRQGSVSINASLDSTDIPQGHLRHVQQSVSLIILSIVFCLFNIPMVFYGIYVSAATKGYTTELVLPIGLMATSSTGLGLFLTPFILVWRFVGWRQLYEKIISFCCSR